MRFDIALSFVVALVAGGSFAAKPQETFSNNREVILAGAELLGWTLDELIEKTIEAMRSCEAEVNRAEASGFGT